MNILIPTAVLLASASLTACGSGQTGNAQSEAATNEVSAAASAGDPFASAEQAMDAAMTAAIGSDAGQSWALKMIAHHEGAIAMSKMVLQQRPTADVAAMAREDIAKQTKDVASIRGLLTGGTPDPKTAEPYRQAVMDMHQAMAAAGGATVSEAYLRKMLAHHQGAVAMSDAALAHGVGGAMKSQVEKTKAENQKDAAMVEGMLSGKVMTMPNGNMNGMDMKGMDMNGMDMNGMNHE